MGGSAAAGAAASSGAGARRLAIWVCLVGLPLAYEASALLPGPDNYYGGDTSYWFSGLQVRLVLTLIGLAAVLWGVRCSGRGLTAIGWPQRLRWWQALLFGAVLVGSVLLALHQPARVSAQVSPVSASTPVTLLERLSLVGLAVVEAPAQELIWRGALIRWLEPSLGTGGAALLSTISFVFFHPTFVISWVVLRAAVPVALVYLGLLLWRRNIKACTFAHFVLVVGQLLLPVAS